MGARKTLIVIASALLFSPALGAQTGAGQSLSVAASSASAESLLNGAPVAWSRITVKRVALNRTPPLYDTDEPAVPEVPSIDVRLVRAGGKLLVQLNWHDATQDATTIASPPSTPPETRFRKVPSEAEDRFFDAAAVMFPMKSGADAMAPSLQMGDADHPVEIYYWNATRGAIVMQAQGRGTTRRSGESFLSHAMYQNGQWYVTMELPDLPAGATLAFAVWNGSQKDRDGRKYFSVWQVLE